MKKTALWACVFSLFIVLQHGQTFDHEEDGIRNVLLEFMSKLTDENGFQDPSSGWNGSSYPCQGEWTGITCDKERPLVTEIVLEGLNLSGVLDAGILCNQESVSKSLLIVDVTDNGVRGENMEDIKNCSQLTHFLIGRNQFSGQVPDSFSRLKNLKVLDISHNRFSGPLPNLSDTSSMVVFMAQVNQFSGPIPDSINFPKLSVFNVSYNNLTGSIPEEAAHHFKTSEFIDNPHLCGPPLPNNCTSSSIRIESEPSPPPAQPQENKTGGGGSNNQVFMYAGYVLIGLAVLFLVLLCLFKRGKKKEEESMLDSDKKKIASVDDSIIKPSFSTVELKAGSYTSKATDVSAAPSGENSMVSSSLVVLASPEVNGLRFEELLKAPAELIGRGKHGSVYKVASQGMILVVKRIKDWAISGNEFKERMRRLDQVQHHNVLPVIAFYSSRQEKLLVYEYLTNGSLFKLIHGSGNQGGRVLDWSNRLLVASKIADALAFMHKELRRDKISHGNLKSSNILLNKNMEPYISEYGLMVAYDNDQHPAVSGQENTNSLFKEDTYAFGVILLEMLTGRMAFDNGIDLASWVLAVVREEWTVEVFDRNLIREGASEERMVNVLQVAIKCVNKSPTSRPDMSQVASMIGSIKEEDERSMDVSGLSTSIIGSFIDV